MTNAEYIALARKLKNTVGLCIAEPAVITVRDGKGWTNATNNNRERARAAALRLRAIYIAYRDSNAFISQLWAQTEHNLVMAGIKL